MVRKRKKSKSKKKMGKRQRIIEVYTSKPIKRVKNPLGHKKKQFVAGSCLVATAEPKTRAVRYSGAGTVKIIPVSHKDFKAITSGMKKRRKRRR